MLSPNQRKQRVFNDLESVEDIVSELRGKFSDKKLYLRYSIEKTELVINEFFDDNTLMVVTDPSVQTEKGISMYGLADKYIEVDLEVIEERGPGYFHCRVVGGRRALHGRKDLRFKVSMDQVIATNFRISKHTIDVGAYNIPTSIKVVLDQFLANNSSLADIVKVDVFKPDDRDAVLKQIRKTGQAVLVSDMSNPESYKAENDNMLDLYSMYRQELGRYIKQAVERGYRSLAVVPIIYINEKQESIPFAYIQLVSKTKEMDIETVLELKELSFSLVDRIRDANTLLIPVHQEVVDLSRGGAKLRVTNDTLKKSMQKARGFIFDLVFKLQAPITIYGEIKAVMNEDGGRLVVSVDFEGNSSRKDELKRFYGILQPMELDYKSRLIKQLKSR